jgi:hypothetical protein
LSINTQQQQTDTMIIPKMRFHPLLLLFLSFAWSKYSDGDEVSVWSSYLMQEDDPTAIFE